MIYHCGNGDFMPVQSFAKKELNADVYLACTGPSLAGVNDKDLHIPGVYTIGINTSYPHIRPDMWIGMDTPGCYHKDLWWEPFPKVMRINYRDTILAGERLRDCPAMYFANLSNGDPLRMFNMRGHDTGFVWDSNTFELAIHVAVWMGAKRIHLLGCDFGGSRDYYDDRELRPEQRSRNHRLYAKLLDRLGSLGAEAEKHGVKLISCTPDSPANDQIEFVPLNEALEASRSRHVPAVMSDKAIYAVDSENAVWATTTGPEDGVIIGVDWNQEWILSWWFEHFRRHNPDLPVAVADFGMTPLSRWWCEQRAKVYHVRGGEKPGHITWHKKPFALLESPFARSIWIDLDCEVRADMRPLFDMTEGGKFVVTIDGHAAQINRPPGAWAGGLIACEHGEPAIEEWCREIMSGDYYGDQDSLNAIRERLAPRVHIAEPEWQWLRLDGDSPTAKIMHWTGPIGKQIIAKQKAAMNAGPNSYPKTCECHGVENCPSKRRT